MMKQKVKKLVGVLITSMLIIIFVGYLGHVVRPLDCDMSVNAVRAFHEMPEDSIQVIGYGSSHMWRGLNVMEMYEEYGIGAYNYGCNWQRINTTLLFLHDSFRTQSPDVVLIECYNVSSLLVDTNVNGEVYYTREIPESMAKQRYLKQCFGDDVERYLSYYMPLCAFHDNWSNLSEGSFLPTSNYRDFTKTMGYVDHEQAVGISIPSREELPQRELSESAVEVLDEMLALCKENDAEVVFYITPYSGAFGYGDAMKKYAAENDCVFLDLYELIDEVGIDGSTDYFDSGHTNISGATKIANYLGKYIVENYELTDMREIENNIWEQALQK